MTTLIKNGTVVNATGTTTADVLVDGETIVALLSPGSTALGEIDADTVIDAAGKYVIPGGVDAHTHMELPFGGTNASDTFETAVGKVGTYICYDRHFPEGWRELGLAGAHMVFNPNATKPGLSNRLWEVEGPCAAVANGYFVLQPNRVGLEDNEYGDEAVNFYGTSQVIDPRGNFVGELGSGDKEEVLVRDLEMDMVREMRNDWQFYRDRRPDSYTSIAKP